MSIISMVYLRKINTGETQLPLRQRLFEIVNFAIIVGVMSERLCRLNKYRCRHYVYVT